MDSKQIRDLCGTSCLLKKYSNYRISTVVYDSRTKENRPEFYFRLVRPDQIGDVGSPHCDYWFDVATETNYGKETTLKFWVPLIQEPGLDGLNLYPEAPSVVVCKSETLEGIKRPKLQGDIGSIGQQHLASLSYGQALMFRDTVMHGGAVNSGKATRVSMEICLVPK